ncbi:MAG: hypothetical protein ABW352_25890 [Polyangiales bacterium]
MIALCMLAGSALAQSEPVALDSRACTRVDDAELRRILALERSLSDDASALRVELRCDGEHAWLRSEGTTRELTLASVPEALRPRLLALAIAELRPAPPPASVVPPAPAPEPQRHRLWLGAHAQASSLLAAGVQLGSSQRLRPWFAWSSGVAFTQGSLSIERGELRVRHASAHTGPTLQRELGRFTLAVGGGVRAGWLGLRGSSREPGVRGERFDTWFVGPTVFGSAALRLARHGFVLLALELTHTVRELNAQVRGGTTRTLSPWLGGASLGVGASW